MISYIVTVHGYKYSHAKNENNRSLTCDRYNKGARDLKPIEPDTTVRIYSKQTKDWSKKGKVIEQLPEPRSYNALNEKGNTIRRNRRSLIPTLENFYVKNDYDEIVVDTEKTEITEIPNDPIEQRLIVTDDNYNVELPQQDTSYKSKLRQNIKKPDRYGY